MASTECGAHKALRRCTFGEKHTVLRVGGAERAPDQTCKKQTRRTYSFPFRVPSRVSRANPPSLSPTCVPLPWPALRRATPDAQQRFPTCPFRVFFACFAGKFLHH